MTRPAVSVIVPFLGDQSEAREAVRMLSRIRARPGDELLIADNTAEGIVAGVATAAVTVVFAGERRSASHARNLGARAAGNDWLLFIDADCIAPAGLIDAYFARPPRPGCGIAAGEIAGAPDQDAVLARWARSRRGNWVSHHLSSGPHPAGVTANLLVRRDAFEQVGGFRIGGGGDLDLCWRVQEHGWKFEYRPEVLILHRDRETLAALASQAVSYGSHQRHLRRLHGTAVPRVPLLRPLGRSVAGALAWGVTGRGERALFKLLDGFWACFSWWGQLTGGRRARRAD